MDKQAKVTDIYRSIEQGSGHPVGEAIRQIGDLAPDVLIGYYQMRDYLMRPPPEGALPESVKRLIIMAYDISHKNTAGAVSHARAYVRGGGDKRAVIETVMLGILMLGMPAYVACGDHVITAALEAAEEAKR